MHHKAKFFLIYSRIPGPNSPNFVTISSCLRPLIDELLVLKDGVTICTPQNPWGQQVYIQLLALCGDLVAIHKVAGFGSHSASQFCSWCKTSLNELQLMEMGSKRSSHEILEMSREWNRASTLSAQENICAKTGVQWSELNRLPYCIPHMHIALGGLHNWLEGILPEHFRYCLGFQRIGQERKQAIKHAMKKSKRAKIKDQLHEDEEESDLSKNSMYSSDSNDLKLGEGVGGGFMSTNDIERFRDFLQTIVQPSGSSRLPHNLGSPSHGKLKAAQWLSLFTLVIPLIIPELYIETSEVIDVKSNRGRFFHAYNCYTTSSRELFNNPRIKPNHHLALHIPEQLKLWGPMMGVSEFAGERMIGALQRVPTNNKICEMHGTILKRALATQQLVGGYKKINEIVNQGDRSGPTRGLRIEVGNNVYMKMLELLRGEGADVRDCSQFPHPPGSFILSRFAKTMRSWPLQDERGSLSVMAPNNVVSYKSDRGMKFGKVSGIYEFRGAHLGETRVGIFLQKIKNKYLSPKYPPGYIGYYL
ncbi:hypothetical protein O181_069587 [Austropuccinia psidii MF-1]|uniref:Uncharacterized protein n=1 Tax=Austropuccinia psidii MF-1 TaxID=1389203 RepID=A0A9Q3I7F6_9BASI|nr:hypothetical protein [Austropuccinia psidii MF-1]